MALYSKRFWSRLAALDAQVVAAQKLHQEASKRMLVASSLVKGGGLEDFWSDLRLCTARARSHIGELRHFCVGRSQSVTSRSQQAGTAGLEA